jgi:hypothetical protein
MEAILHHRIVEALLLKDHALPVQLRLKTQTTCPVEVVKMQTKHRIVKEVRKERR